MLAFFLSVANAFDSPARVSFVAELVSREDMTNAIALNATMFNIATVTGPAIAGLTYASFGPAWCFTINGISFIAVIVALLLMKLKPAAAPARRGTALQDLMEGVRYVFANPLILSLIGFMGLMSVFGMGVLTLLPAWAKDILNGDVTTNGWMVSARGVGSLVGALMLAALGKSGIRGKLWTIGSLLMPVLLFLFALTRWLPLSMLLLVGSGWSLIMVANNSNAMVQTQLDDRLRGRVMSVYTLVFFGAMPLGSFMAGSVAEVLQEPLTVMISASIMGVLALLVLFFLPAIRRQE